MAIKIETVGELIEALKKFDPGAHAYATWEGITRDIAIYRDKEGQCVVDADDCFYEKGHSDGSL